MALRLWGQDCKVSMTLLTHNSKTRLEHKEIETKYREMTRKPQGQILIISNTGYSCNVFNSPLTCVPFGKYCFHITCSFLFFYQTGLPSGYSHFHTPVSYPHVPSYGPFGGVPSYGGYPPGIPQRPMPGHMQPPMGMMPPPAVMPQRIGTPPAIPPLPLSRGHSPSPDSVLPGSSSTKSAESQGNESRSRTTSQQGTQTVQTKKKPSSRPSSRRNSEDKTEQPLESKKKPEVKKEEKETTSSKEATGGNQTPAEPQKQRQGIKKLVVMLYFYILA